jgi:hypothetical protein
MMSPLMLENLACREAKSVAAGAFLATPIVTPQARA